MEVARWQKETGPQRKKRLEAVGLMAQFWVDHHAVTWPLVNQPGCRRQANHQNIEKYSPENVERMQQGLEPILTVPTAEEDPESLWLKDRDETFQRGKETRRRQAMERQRIKKIDQRIALRKGKDVAEPRDAAKAKALSKRKCSFVDAYRWVASNIDYGDEFALKNAPSQEAYNIRAQAVRGPTERSEFFKTHARVLAPSQKSIDSEASKGDGIKRPLEDIERFRKISKALKGDVESPHGEEESVPSLRDGAEGSGEEPGVAGADTPDV